MRRTLIIHVTVTVDGVAEPEMTLMQRIPWPEDMTLEDVAEAEAHRFCRELHAPTKVITLAC